MNIPTGQWQLVESAFCVWEGAYKLQASMNLLPPGVAMNAAIRITVNGSVAAQTDRLASSWPHGGSLGCTVLRALGLNDDVRVEVFQDSGQTVESPPALLRLSRLSAS